METKTLITKHFGRYRIKNKVLADGLAYITSYLGITKYEVYHTAYRLYKKKPYVYDMYDGSYLLLIKVAMAWTISSHYPSQERLSNRDIFECIRYILQGVSLDQLIGGFWTGYNYIFFQTQKTIFDKLEAFGYLEDNHCSILVYQILFKASFILSWPVEHFTQKNFTEFHQIYYSLLMKEVKEEYKTQAQNVINQVIDDTDEDIKKTQVYFY